MAKPAAVKKTVDKAKPRVRKALTEAQKEARRVKAAARRAAKKNGTAAQKPQEPQSGRREATEGLEEHVPVQTEDSQRQLPPEEQITELDNRPARRYRREQLEGQSLAGPRA